MLSFVRTQTLTFSLPAVSLGITVQAAGFIGRCAARCPTHQFQCGRDHPHLGSHWCSHGGLGHQF
jgi:hypothetical protein